MESRLYKIRHDLSVVFSIIFPLAVAGFVLLDKVIGWSQPDCSGAIVAMFLGFPLTGFITGLFTVFENKHLLIPEIIALGICIIAIVTWGMISPAIIFPCFLAEWFIGACFPFTYYVRNYW